MFNWPVPVNMTEVHSFLDLAGYCQRYIQGFSFIALPLTRLTRKKVKFDWGMNVNVASKS